MDALKKKKLLLYGTLVGVGLKLGFAILRHRLKSKILVPRCAVVRRVQLCRRMWRASAVHGQIQATRIQFIYVDGATTQVREWSLD